jgi:predicted ATPase/class 3 adenylate cyclase
MTETRALLLTDVVGSTELTRQLGDAAMAQLWAAHDRLARDLLPGYGGREIDKTDGMLLMFERAADAAAYARAYHRALAGLTPRLEARAGLHVGPVLLRENPPADVARGAKPLEVEGLAKPMAARVMSLAGAGQTLLTTEALAALGDGHDWRAESHGHWVMKGVAEPVEVFEIGDATTRFAAPADADKVYRVVRVGDRWLPVKSIANNLPQQATTFVGRERELDELKVLLGKARLITLLGMGGLGKTRLSLQVAAETMPQFPDGAWFVDLSPIRDPALVVAEAARVLDVAEEPGRPLIEALCAHLRPRRLLLVLDNCEHLVDAAGDLVDALLKAVPQLRVMASSREPLDVPGEQNYPVHPLPLPNAGDGVAALMRSTAARLFVERVRQHRPDFAIEDDEAGYVADLVARLEGIPLAIELAAARMRTLGVAEINAALRQRFDVLTGGSRRLQARQQTLRALVDWSYDLLGAHEQRLLNRLGVFVGGFDLAAAQAVCGAEPITVDEVEPILASLSDKSLLIREASTDGVRWRMLDTIREYAADKLAAGGEHDAVAARHCAHFFELTRSGSRGLAGDEQASWLRRFETEADNLRAARAAAVTGRGIDPVLAVKIGVNLMGFWMLRGRASEGRAALREAIALPAVQASDLAHAWGLYAAAGLASSQGEHAEARRLLERCLALRRGLGNPVQIAATLSTLALTRLETGDAEGAAAGEREALALFREQGDRVGEAIGHLHLGQIAMVQGDDAAAAGELEQARALACAISHHEVEGESERLLGQLALLAGDVAGAVARFERSMQVCRDAGDKRGEANALRWSGKAALRAGSLMVARQQLGEALRAFDAYEMRQDAVAAIEDHAELACALEQAERALELAAAATQARARLALPRPPRDEQRWQALLTAARAGVAEADASAATARGRRWEMVEAIQAALSLPRVGAVAVDA